MAEQIVYFLQQYISAELAVFVVSMLPILELRGGLIAASLLGIPWVKAAVISVAGNILPIPVILLFVRQVLDFLGRTRLFRHIAHFFQSKALRRGGELMEKYPRRVQFALYVFVAIPLPGTGAWTGALIAAFLNLPVRRSLPAILLGVLTAGAVMLILAYALPSLVGLK